MGTQPEPPTSVPSGWKSVPDDVFDYARSVTLEALDIDETRQGDVAPAVERLGAYYDPDGNYAGSTYLSVEPNDPNVFTVADLYAATLLRVDIDARSTRRFTDFGPSRARLAMLLGNLPVDVHLAEADANVLEAMAALHDEVKLTLAPSGKEATSSKWVTAAKLCARKRPNLFPVRDSVIREVLGLLRLQSYQIDYQVFRKLMQDQEVQQVLSDLIEKFNAEHPRWLIDSFLLRVLDVALWTYGIKQAQ